MEHSAHQPISKQCFQSGTLNSILFFFEFVPYQVTQLMLMGSARSSWQFNDVDLENF